MNTASPGINRRVWELFGVSSWHFRPEASPVAPSVPTRASKLHRPDHTSHVCSQATEACLQPLTSPPLPRALTATSFLQPQPEPLSFPHVSSRIPGPTVLEFLLLCG